MPVTATAVAAGGASAAASACLSVDSAPALRVSLDEDADPATAGEALSYTVSYGNPSAVGAPGTTLRALVPEGTAFLSADGGGELSGSWVTWPLGTLAAGQSGSRRFTVRVGADVADGEILLGRAELTDVGGMATAESATAVAAESPLVVDLSVSPDPARQGEYVTVTMTAANRGASDLAGVELRLLTPDHVGSWASWDALPPSDDSSNYYTGDGALWTLGTLVAGESRTVAVAVQVDFGSTDKPSDGTLVPVTATAVAAGGASAAAQSNFRIGNTIPHFDAIPNRIIGVGGTVMFTATATDRDVPDVQRLSFSLVSGAALGATINASTGVFSWKPSASQPSGEYVFTIRVTDNGIPPQSDEISFTITYEGPRQTISGKITDSVTGVGVADVAITFSNGGGVTTTDAGGNYSRSIPKWWAGTVTPEKTEGGVFAPVSKTYSSLTANLTAQNFTWAQPGVMPFTSFANSPDNLALKYKIVSGIWFYSEVSDGLRCVTPPKGGSSAMQVSVTGPGILSFGWELAGGDGTNVLTCMVGLKTLATNKTDGGTADSSVAVPAGSQTVKWTVTRGKNSGEAVGIIRDVFWTPLGKASTPVPENGQVLMRRNFTGLSWNSTSDFCRVYAGLSATALKPVGNGIYDAGNVPATDLDAILDLAAGKTVFWRVDTVMRDAGGNEAVNPGVVGSFTALAEGAPEFSIYTPIPVTLTAGVWYDLGPFVIVNVSSGTLSCAVRSGTLAPGMKIAARGSDLYVTGVPSKAGRYQTVVQVSRKTGTLTAPGTTLALDLTVFALDRLATGTFNGWVENSVYGSGTASMTVTGTGNISGKLFVGATNYTFTSASYSGETNDGFYVEAVAKSGTKPAFPVSIKIGRNGQAVASFSDEPSAVFALLRNNWKEPDMLAVATNYAGYYTATLPGESEYGSGYLTFTVDKLGGVKTAGKLADGTAVSLSGVLIMDENGRVFAVLYTSPTAYKSGSLFGLAEFYKAAENVRVVVRLLDGLAFNWENRSPLATGDYGTGFSRTLGLTGGWYDKTGNLYDYYRGRDLLIGTDGTPVPEAIVGTNRYESAWWNPDGLTLTVVTNKLGILTGLSAPKAGLPVDPEKDRVWDYGAPNSVGLSVSLTRATGVFKGSFKAWFDYAATHTPKSIAFEGVLTPEREDTTDGIAGRGFFLWPDKSQYLNLQNKMTPYSFNWSYDLLLLSQ